MSNLLHQTLGQILHMQSERFPDSDALVSDSVRYTYPQLLEESGITAKYLLSAGVGRGTHVGIWSNDCPEMISLMFALWRIGAVAMPMNTSYSLRELRDCVDVGDVEYIIIDSGCRDTSFPELCSQLQKPEQSHIIAMNHVANSSYKRICELPCVEDAVLAEAENAVDVQDTDTILFTSGSTGYSKPVETSHFSRVNTMIRQAWALDADENDRFCSVLPLYHCFSITAVVLAAVVVGAGVYFPQSRRTQDILSCIEKYRCTVLTSVPTLFSALLRRQKESEYDVSSLRTGMIGGSSYPPEFFIQICREFDYTLLPSLGQTEATAGLTNGSMCDSLEVRSTTLGVAFPDVELRIDKPDGKIQSMDSPGEICLRGFNVMKGYYNQPESTAKVIDSDGWLHTGDMGWIDTDGRLHYSGRIKEIIIRGSENIFPGEVERVILSDSRIAECKVVGVPDEHFIEEICACVVPEAGENMSEDDVRELVASSLSYYKVPKYVMFLETLPMKGTGKADGTLLKKMAEQHFGLKETDQIL